ncbi:MAG: hypothetical protein AAF441_18470 [Pseudomonadota bacterium]
MSENREPRDWLVYSTPRLKPQGKPGGGKTFDPNKTYRRPEFYPTSSPYLWKNIGRKDRIWMLGCPRIAGRTLAPGIDGVIVVKQGHEVSKRKMPHGPASPVSGRKYWFEAGAGSRWFPWADASALIPACDLERADGSYRRLPGKPARNGENGKGWWKTWGNLLRPGSKISRPAAEMIEQHVASLTGQSVFISYAWSDGALLASRLAEIFSEKEHAVWLDRFSAPRQMAFGMVEVKSRALGPFLTMALKQCDAFAQIGTAGARRVATAQQKASWCLHELEQARRKELPGAGIELEFDQVSARWPIADDEEQRLNDLAEQVLSELRRSAGS